MYKMITPVKQIKVAIIIYKYSSLSLFPFLTTVNIILYTGQTWKTYVRMCTFLETGLAGWLLGADVTQTCQCREGLIKWSPPCHH